MEVVILIVIKRGPPRALMLPFKNKILQPKNFHTNTPYLAPEQKMTLQRKRQVISQAGPEPSARPLF